MRQLKYIFPVLFFIFTFSFAQTRARAEINIPDIAGYKTLKCDFHMHTVFSDGNVWPSIRAEEAWRHGLDAIALTDHLEYIPHKDDVIINYNRPYEIAKPAGEALDIIVIKGSEITRGMPPGHFNAIFLSDASKLKTDKWQDAFLAAKEQGAYIFWNHPGWKSHQPDGIPRWYDEHTWLLENGMLNGIEAVNEREYYPDVFQWCLDKNLTVMSNSDVHDPVNMFWEMDEHDFRPITLVFAEERSEQGIKDALFAGRTVAYADNTLIGREEYIRELFNNSITINKTSFDLKGKGWVNVMIKNNSGIPYKLISKNNFEEIRFADEITLAPNKTVILGIGGKDKDREGTKKFTLLFDVENIKIQPGKNLPVELEFDITFIPVTN
jgi:hypothetical protein